MVRLDAPYVRIEQSEAPFMQIKSDQRTAYRRETGITSIEVI